MADAYVISAPPTRSSWPVPTTTPVQRTARRRPRLETTPGAYAAVPAWTSRRAYLAAVAVLAARYRADRAASLHAVARVLASAAEHETGRSVELAVATIAHRSDVAERTVYRRLADLRDAGLAVVVEPGRHITRDERTRAGVRTWRRTSSRALTVPADLAAHLPDRRSGEVLPSAGGTKRARRAASTTTSTTDRPARTLSVQLLAAGVAARLPYLVRHRHIGGLADVLTRAGVHDWTPTDITTAVDAWHAEHGWKTLATGASDPLAWFATALHRARRDGAKSRSAAARAELDAARTRAAQRRHEHAVAATRAASAEASGVAAAARAAIRAAVTTAKARRLYGATAA